MSPNESSFVVSVNSSTGDHIVELDPLHSEYLFFGNHSDKIFSSKSFDTISEFSLIKHHAESLNTYVNVDKINYLLWIQGLKNRLVITLPQSVHHLGNTKFYIILKAINNDDVNRSSKGVIFFRQDQLHIDLFVFFSVFFSCFFLFLAVCVVGWKIKQATDVRRARRRHIVEMRHMAKRPFATVTLLLGPHSPYTQRRKTKIKQLSSANDILPIAVEPTSDGLAAVTSVFVKLPGGRSAPTRLALASSLVLLARQLPSSGRTFLGRRNIPVAP